MSSSKFLSCMIISIDASLFWFLTALKSSKPMIVARKPGKLPGHIVTREYDLEYGKKTINNKKSFK